MKIFCPLTGGDRFSSAVETQENNKKRNSHWLTHWFTTVYNFREPIRSKTWHYINFDKSGVCMMIGVNSHFRLKFSNIILKTFSSCNKINTSRWKVKCASVCVQVAILFWTLKQLANRLKRVQGWFSFNFILWVKSQRNLSAVPCLKFIKKSSWECFNEMNS